MRSRVLYLQSPQWSGLLELSADLFATAGFQEVKNIARNRAGFLATPQGTVFVKRFTPGSRVQGLLERMRGSRAARSLRAAAMLTGAGFLVPSPLAAREEIAAGAILTSWIFSEALIGARVFSRFIERGRAPAPEQQVRRRQALTAVARCVRRLHDAGLFTTDLQETNLMLDEVDGEIKIHFVDLDGFGRLARVSWRRRRRNLVQLDRSVGRFMSGSERLRFLYTYLGANPDRDAVRKLAARLMHERRRKDRRFARRRGRHAGASLVNAGAGEAIASDCSHPA
jgi:tRNA A-37 threonylcarbamoyl transferase component Bud32